MTSERPPLSLVLLLSSIAACKEPTADWAVLTEATEVDSTTDLPTDTGMATSEGSTFEPVCVDDSESIPDGFLGVEYFYTLTANGGASPYTWDATNLPPGLELVPDPLDDSKATLMGTPTESGTYDVEVTLADGEHSGSPTSCGSLEIFNPPQFDADKLLAQYDGCVPLGVSLNSLISDGIVSSDAPMQTFTCALETGRGSGSGNFDADANTEDTAPTGITLDPETCTPGGAIDSDLPYGIYAFITSFSLTSSASSASAYVPYCAANMDQPSGSYGIMREDAGDVSTFLPGVQQLSPGQGIDYGTAVPDPKVTVDYGMTCPGGSCFYAYVFSYNTVSSGAMVSTNPNTKFPANGFEGFTHAIRISDDDPELLERFEARPWIVNMTFNHCIATNDMDCGNSESDSAKRADMVRTNGKGNYYFSLVLLPTD